MVGSHRGEAGMVFGSSRRPNREIGNGSRGGRHVETASMAHLIPEAARQRLRHREDRSRVVASGQPVGRDTKVAQYRTVYRYNFLPRTGIFVTALLAAVASEIRRRRRAAV